MDVVDVVDVMDVMDVMTLPRECWELDAGYWLGAGCWMLGCRPTTDY